MIEGFPTSPQQQYAFDLDSADPSNHLVKTRCRWLLEGALDRDILAQSLDALLARHAILRTTFRVVGDTLRQFVSPLPATFELAFEDLGSLDDGAREARAQQITREIAGRAIDLATGPIVRALLIGMGVDRHILVIVVHHIAFDAGSAAPFSAELRDAYCTLLAARSGTSAATWREPALQYVDFAGRLAELARSPGGAAQRAFWDAQLAGAQALELPVDLSRDAIDARRDGATRGIAVGSVGETSAEIPLAVRDAIGRLGRDERASPYMLFLAGFISLLHRMRGQTDVCVQSTYSFRGRPELAAMIGYVGNALALRVDASGNPSFREVLRRTRSVVVAAWAHSDVPIVDRVPHALRRVNFNYVPIGPGTFRRVELAPALSSTRMPIPVDSAHVQIPFDLHLWLLDTPTRTSLRLLFLRELFRPETASAMLVRFVEVLAEMGHSPDRAVS